MQPLALIAYPNVDPIAFSIGPLAVRWYALSYIAGIVFAVWYIRRLVANPVLWNGKTPTATPQQIDDVFVWITLGVILGGRIGYILFYMLPLAAGRQALAQDPLEIIRLWHGGMSFHGGFLGVAAAIILYARSHRIELLRPEHEPLHLRAPDALEPNRESASR